MSESPYQIDKIQNKLLQVRRRVKDTVSTINWRTNPDTRQAHKDLLLISRDSNIRHIDPDNPPKVLNFTVGNREFVSIRREEGRVLYSWHDGPEGDLSRSRAVFEIDKDRIPDGAVGFFIVPSSATCLNDEILEKVPEPEAFWPYFEWVISEGVKYDPRDWKLDSPRTAFIKRVGNNFYKLNYLNLDRLDRSPTISKVEPEGNKLKLAEDSIYLTEEEIRIKRQWYDTRARFYVLLEGSSKRETKRKELHSLVPKPAEINIT